MTPGCGDARRAHARLRAWLRGCGRGRRFITAGGADSRHRRPTACVASIFVACQTRRNEQTAFTGTATASEATRVRFVEILSGPTIQLVAAILSNADNVPYCLRDVLAKGLAQLAVNPEYPSRFLQLRIALTPPADVKFLSATLYFRLNPYGNDSIASPTGELSRVLM